MLIDKIVHFAPRAENEVLPARGHVLSSRRSRVLETIESCKTLSAVVGTLFFTTLHNKINNK
jgi:hypothetical protein